jgi:lactate dehydrogenase-like 2-hydroxyacid dehydrogenase
MDMDNGAVPHLGSATVYTRAAMDQLLFDNLLSWAAGRPPVPETPMK